MRKTGKEKQQTAKHCYYCGKPFGNGIIATKDHVWPKYLNGTNHGFNIVITCYECNNNKGHAPPPDNMARKVKAAALARINYWNKNPQELDKLWRMVNAIKEHLKQNKAP